MTHFNDMTQNEKIVDLDERTKTLETESPHNILRTPISDGGGFANAVNKTNKQIDSKFNRNRWIAMSVFAIAFFVLSWWLFEINSLFFSYSLGFMISDIGLLFVLLIDQWLINVDTFKEISKSPIAIAIVILSIVGLFWIGVSTGQQLQPNAIRGEASSAAQVSGYDTVAPEANDGEIGSQRDSTR
jgi:hypothetical protein